MSVFFVKKLTKTKVFLKLGLKRFVIRAISIYRNFKRENCVKNSFTHPIDILNLSFSDVPNNLAIRIMLMTIAVPAGKQFFPKSIINMSV